MNTQGMAPPTREVPMIEPDSVQQLRQLRAQGWGSKRIARELGLARNTVKRYLRGGASADKQERPAARALDAEGQRLALTLFDGEAAHNAVVVTELLRARGYDVAERTVQKLVAHRRVELRASAVASVRFETAPGAQMQIDFGQKLVWIAGALVRVYLLVAVLGYSRRLFVKAFLAERQDDWLEGIACAFRRFGGVARTLLGDNARALVLTHDRVAQTLTFHPSYLAFCRDWDVTPRACAPYRARTKGKTESGVKYAKHNALAGRKFDSFASLETHLGEWMDVADKRIHGTTHETPLARFLRDEVHALKPLPSSALPLRERRLKRRVANDAFVDVDTIRYSVPHPLVRDHVEVHVGECQVRIFHGTKLVATHARVFEPRTLVRDEAHFAGLWRRAEEHVEPQASKPVTLARSLEEYATVITPAGAA